MKKIQLIVLLLIFQHVHCELNKTPKCYQQIIAYIDNYYECDSIISFGSTLNGEFDIITEMTNLRSYSTRWNKQLTIVQESIKLKQIEKFKKGRKPLIVFFNETKNAKFQLIASTLDISKPVFLFFVNDQTRVEDFFSNIYFSYEYKFIISQRNKTNQNQEIISEIKLDNKKKKIVTLLFATWSEVTGIISCVSSDVISLGHILRAGIRHNPPLSIVEKVGNNMKLKGYLSKIAESLESQMNFKFTYTFISETGFKENGTWGGGMGLLINNSIDVFFTPLFISLDRHQDVDFSFAFLTSNLAMFIKKPGHTFNWTSYFKPFDITVWCAIILVIITGSIAYTVFEYYTKIYVIWRLRRKPIKFSVKYGESLLNVHSAMCGQGLQPSVFNPLRILQFTIHITAILILAFYSAVLLRLITKPEFKLPITSFKELIEDSSYKLGAINGQPWNIFKQSEDKIMQKIFHTHIKTQNPIPTSHITGFKRMCKNQQYAFITYDNLAYSYSSSNCTLLFIEHLAKSQLAFAFQHNSPYTKMFNKQLLKMYESGELKKIERQYFPSSTKIEDLWTPIDELEVLSIILILLGCMLFSIILLLLEILIYRRIDRQKIKSCFHIFYNSYLKPRGF